MTDGQSEIGAVQDMEKDAMSETGERTFEFDLGDLVESDNRPEGFTGSPAATEVEQWADKIVSQREKFDAVFYDIETGPRPEDELRQLFREKTLEEFTATCDKRWKPDTVAAKYKEYREKAWGEFVGKAALSPVTGRVLLIGVIKDGHFVGISDDNEANSLGLFWAKVDEWLGNKLPIIGHNSNSFDLPFLIRRSWLLGVDVPREIRQGRHWHPLFRDTMEYWNCGAKGYVSLNSLGEAFGVGQKTEGIHGKDFHRWWFGEMEWNPTTGAGTPAEQREKALEYAEQDVQLTAAVAAKMGMV